jgi:hypothetical protein
MFARPGSWSERLHLQNFFNLLKDHKRETERSAKSIAARISSLFSKMNWLGQSQVVSTDIHHQRSGEFRANSDRN